jgi:adenylosuccinate synthase
MAFLAQESASGDLITLLDVKRGDAGKAKVAVDHLARGSIGLVIRPIGGAGSGRTACIEGQKVVFSQVPEGVAFHDVTAAIGDMAFVYPDAYQFADPILARLFNGRIGLLQEMQRIEAQGFWRGQLVISPRAPLVMPWHLLQDMLEEIIRTPHDIGTTVNGMGPIASSFFARNSLRVADLLLKREALRTRFSTVFRLNQAVIRGLMASAREYFARLSHTDQLRLNDRFKTDLLAWLQHRADQPILSSSSLLAWLHFVQSELQPYIRDVAEIVAENRRCGAGLLILATNGRKLHPVFGDYPMVTTSLISVPSILELSGLPASSVTRPNAHIMAVIKAYDTHVGEGHFPTELHDDLGDQLRIKGREFGTVTGRPRRVGWLDLVSARTGMQLQDINELSVTRLDILSGLPQLKVCTRYEYRGRRLDVLPADVPITECQPVYIELPGWDQDITGATEISALPAQAIVYLRQIEQALGCPITHIGTGPAQNECILSENGESVLSSLRSS